MKFKTFQLLINDDYPNKEHFATIEKQGLMRHTTRNYLYNIVEKEFIEERFFWMCCDFDNPDLYNEKVIDQQNFEEQQNPRSKNQAELREQMFSCYDMNNHLLYINDIDCRRFYKEYISSTLGKEVTIKSVFSSLDDFQSAIKYLSQIKFVQKHNLQNQAEGSVLNQFVSPYGMDLPNRLVVKADYGKTPVAQLRSGFQKLMQHYNHGLFEDLVLCGLDDSGVEMVFDFQAIIKSVQVNLGKNNDRRFSTDSVKDLLLAQIRG